jgi:GGDEF domain-containing protein
MEKKSGDSSFNGGSIIAAICIVIYLFAMVQGAVRLYLSTDRQKLTAELEFNQIADLALSASMHGFMSDRYVQIMNNALLSTKSLEALIITGTEGGYAFEKKSGHAINWVNNAPRFINKFSFSNQNLYRPLPLPDIRNANIKAVASAVDFAGFIGILKQTLLLIIVGLAVSFFTMIIQLLTAKAEKPKGDVIHASQGSQKTANAESFKEAQPANISDGQPKGLYSSRSNIGWEEYTQDRLDSELHRCASTEKDLALIHMEFSAITNDLMFMQAAEEAVNFFTSRDLLFESGDQGMIVILPGIGLDTAIGKAEKFYQRITEKFPNSFGTESSLNIGLSSRSGRLINGDRIILEANEALKKAKRDFKTSIIAFKSDPDKYRKFISRQN